MRRRVALIVPAIVLAGSLVPVHAQQSGQGWLAAVRAVLQARASAVERGDRAEFQATMEGAPADFVSRQMTWFDRLRSLPLGSYKLDLIDEEFGDLARPKDRARYGADVHIVQAKSRIGFRGYDERPSDEDTFLSLVRHKDTWSVMSDTDVEDAGLLSDRGLWDFGPIDRQEKDGIMVVYHPDEASAAPKVLDAAAAARARVRKSWPLGWDAPIIVMIPSTVGELARILQTTFELSTFVAFAASSVDRVGGWKLAGNRVFLHWPNFKKYSASYQQQILSHEFTHLATRNIAGPYVTAIMDEGIAQYYGEGGGRTEQMTARVRKKTLPPTLVPDWMFTAGPSDDIYLSYEEAASFIKFLGTKFGHDAGAKAYRSLGTINPVTPGSWRYHLDRVTQSLFHQSFAALERQWSQSVYRELK